MQRKYTYAKDIKYDQKNLFSMGFISMWYQKIHNKTWNFGHGKHICCDKQKMNVIPIGLLSWTKKSKSNLIYDSWIHG